MKLLPCLFIVMLVQYAVADLPSSASPDDAKVYIITPENGAVVTSPVKIIFGLSAMGVAPAGVNKSNTGHHHLLIDRDQLPVANQPMGGDVKHFGGGQTEVRLDLSAGRHSLQLLLGDSNHIPHQPPVISKKIIITVQ